MEENELEAIHELHPKFGIKSRIKPHWCHSKQFVQLSQQYEFVRPHELTHLAFEPFAGISLVVGKQNGSLGNIACKRKVGYDRDAKPSDFHFGDFPDRYFSNFVDPSERAVSL
jgi:hypothetical protein